MIALINDLLNLARIEEGRYAINLVTIDLVKTCREVAVLAEENFKTKGLAFSIDLPGDKKIFVSADEEKLKVVIQNFLDNASKYTPRGGEVKLSLKEGPKNVKIEVEDNGVGVSAKEKERIFTKFFRSSQAVLLEPAGSGLGLYMAKNIIEGHGGKIGFESRSSQGTIFYFILPKQSGKKEKGPLLSS